MIEAKHLKKGSYILHNEEPCRVKQANIVVTGTHSHTKIKLVIVNIFTGIAYDFTLPQHKMIPDVEIIRKHGQIVSKTGDIYQIMDMRTYETLDASADTELAESITEGNGVTFIDYAGKARIVEKR